MKGIFGNMFDLNHDGNISLLESTMEFIFLNELLKDDSEERTELELSGLDPDELEFMDPMNEEKYWKMPDWIRMNMISKEEQLR